MSNSSFAGYARFNIIGRHITVYDVDRAMCFPVLVAGCGYYSAPGQPIFESKRYIDFGSGGRALFNDEDKRWELPPIKLETP